MQSIICWGASGHAKVVAQTLRRLGRWRLEGFIDDRNSERRGEAFCGARVLGGREALTAARARGIEELLFAFGDNAARLALWCELEPQGWRFPALLDPAAVVADDVEIGAGSYVAAGAIVQPGVRIGAQVIVNSGAIVEHDSRIGDGVHIAPRACLAGHVEVGRGSWIGAGSVVRDRVHIGAAAVIGIGSLVLHDVPDGVVAYGHPARCVREAKA